MRKIADEPRSETCSESDAGAQQAILHCRELKQGPSGKLLEINLETGRSHQIRLQSATRGMPVWGDEWYGSEQAFGPETDDPRRRAIALHAGKLEFSDPATESVVCHYGPVAGMLAGVGQGVGHLTGNGNDPSSHETPT